MACFMVCLLAGLLLGCSAVPSPLERSQAADALAASRGWQKITLVAQPFELTAYGPKVSTPMESPTESTTESTTKSPTDSLTVYIEGDGLAWMNRATPSSDPTPRDPVALRMALADPYGTAVYLARPCQYVGGKIASCDQRYWTNARFAQEVIASTDQAISALKQRYGAREIVLVGYSGGAAVAALVAARRIAEQDDVVGLVTVAGNLDHRAWTQYHRVKPLTGSLNAADVAPKLQSIAQLHLVGEDDQVIPPILAQGWPVEFIGVSESQLKTVPGYGHGCCWAEDWTAMQQGDVVSVLVKQRRR